MNVQQETSQQYVLSNNYAQNIHIKFKSMIFVGFTIHTNINNTFFKIVIS